MVRVSSTCDRASPEGQWERSWSPDERTRTMPKASPSRWRTVISPMRPSPLLSVAPPTSTVARDAGRGEGRRSRRRRAGRHRLLPLVAAASRASREVRAAATRPRRPSGSGASTGGPPSPAWRRASPAASSRRRTGAARARGPRPVPRPRGRRGAIGQQVGQREGISRLEGVAGMIPTFGTSRKYRNRGSGKSGGRCGTMRGR